MARRGPKPIPFECPELLFWYLVGLIATDGCLSSNGRCVNITSKDEKYLLQIKSAAGLRCGVSQKRGGYGTTTYQLQIGSKDLHTKLSAIGLTPRKTWSIGPLKVPDRRFSDFLRGAIDGDGSIHRWIHRTNGREQWALCIVGISRPFLDWLNETVERLWSIKGSLHIEPRKDDNHSTKYILKYGKLAARAVLARAYYSGAFALGRKAKIAAKCLNVSVGWSKSKTVTDPKAWKNWQYRHEWEDRATSYVLDGPAVFTMGVPKSVVRCDAPG